MRAGNFFPPAAWSRCHPLLLRFVPPPLLDCPSTGHAARYGGGGRRDPSFRVIAAGLVALNGDSPRVSHSALTGATAALTGAAPADDAFELPGFIVYYSCKRK